MNGTKHALAATIAGSTSTAVTFHPLSWRRPTTLNVGDQPPAEFSNQKVSELTGAIQVRRTLVWDGEGAIGRCRSGKVELTGDCQAFRGVLGANPGHSAPNAAARHRYPTRRPSTRQLCPAALV